MSHSDAIHGRHAAEPVPPAFVRSFTLTRGRTIPRVDLPFEATLVVTDKNSQSPVSGQHAEALALCDGRSVAEIAAEMNLPIGVVRVLVGDLEELTGPAYPGEWSAPSVSCDDCSWRSS